MANRTHSSPGHSQRFEWNLLATSEHRYGEPDRLGPSKIAEPSDTRVCDPINVIQTLRPV